MSEPLNFLAELTGSFARPAADNPTVAMIEAAYQHHGLNWRYINFEVAPEDLADAVRGARALRFAGFNCSLPHKVEVIQHLDGLGESAAIMGAVNCAVRRDEQYIGENTDGKGFTKSLLKVVDPKNKRVVMFGAGGAARAIGVETALLGASHFTVVNRSKERGQELVELLNEKTPVNADLVLWEGDYDVPTDTDIVVNATSIGMFPDVDAQIPVNVESLQPSMVVADVIANPLRTNLIKDAESRGCTVLDGLGMLVNQGVISIKYWTGVDVEAQVMRDKIVEIIER
ncbi:MAG: shikimate dehydrogenase [Planctomycetaceae bacterium]|nr:shikimate dehydrogenase [Planctomycetaceae bacterium]